MHVKRFLGQLMLQNVSLLRQMIRERPSPSQRRCMHLNLATNY